MQSRPICVMDIGSKKISLFIGTKGVNDIFIVKARSELDYAGFADGEWLDYNALGGVILRVIRQAESIANIRIKKLYLGVPGEFTTVVVTESSLDFGKPHTISPADLDKLHLKGKEYEAKGQYVAINSAPIFYTLDESVRQVDPVGSQASRLTGLISFILADKKFYLQISRLLDKIGLSEVEFIAANWAEGMYLFDDETRDKYVLLSDIGYITSTISLFRGDGVLFQRSFSLGSGHIDADLLRVLDIPYDQAVELRKKVNLNLVVTDEDKYDIIVEGKRSKVNIGYVQNIVSARVMDIGELLQECLSQCDYHCPEYVPLYLTGGGISSIVGAKDIIGKIINRRVELIAPNVPEYTKPEYSSTFGIMHIAARLEEKSSGIMNIINKLFRK